MATNPDARLIVEAIKENTRELRKVREAIEKMGKKSPVMRPIEMPSSDPLDLDEPQYDVPK